MTSDAQSAPVTLGTVTSRPGRRFEPTHELSLHDDATAAAAALPKADGGLLMAPEFQGPIGVPDFTAFVGDLNALTRRSEGDLVPLTHPLDCAAAMAFNVARPISVETAAERLGWPLRLTTDRVARLEKSRALTRVSGKSLLRNPLLSPSGRIYAIEAKLYDWRSALRQGRAYGVWADAYVLVMSRVSDKGREALLTEVKADGGGLVIDGRWLLKPRVHQIDHGRRLQAFELLAAEAAGQIAQPSLAP